MICKRIIKITNQSAIVLGKQGENIVAVHFPQSSELMDEEWVLNHRRATDALAYPVPLTKDGGDLVWAVTLGDTEIPGRGEAELVCRGKSGQVLKSRTYTTHVVPGVSAGGDVPDPVKPWYDAIMDELSQATSGGYYSPQVSQAGDYEMEVAFTPSKEDMPRVPQVTIRLLAGPPGEPGEDGSPGKDGLDGHTPEKGVDYWTEADRAAMVADTLAALPTWEGGELLMPNYKVVDADKLDADLGAVADAIRKKGGTVEALAFPVGFKSAVEAIEAPSGKFNGLYGAYCIAYSKTVVI